MRQDWRLTPMAPIHEHGSHDHAAHLALDPVCGMRVDPHTAKHRAEHEGRQYYFCSAGCRTKFLADPARYLGTKAEAVPEGAIYTCPMHPEIRRLGPGSCPICGMALEPILATADAGPKSRTGRHDAAVLGRIGAGHSGGGARDGWAPDQSAHAARPGVVELDSVRDRYAGRLVGRLAVLRAWLAVGRDAQS